MSAPVASAIFAATLRNSGFATGVGDSVSAVWHMREFGDVYPPGACLHPPHRPATDLPVSKMCVLMAMDRMAWPRGSRPRCHAVEKLKGERVPKRRTPPPCTPPCAHPVSENAFRCEITYSPHCTVRGIIALRMGQGGREGATGMEGSQRSPCGFFQWGLQLSLPSPVGCQAWSPMEEHPLEPTWGHPHMCP